jgi:ADP-glucose pyrophosphorylase
MKYFSSFFPHTEFKYILSKSSLINYNVIYCASMCSQQMDIQNGVDRKGIDIPIGIGEDTQIRKAIVDKNARIGKNVLVCKIQENSKVLKSRLNQTHKHC